MPQNKQEKPSAHAEKLAYANFSLEILLILLKVLRPHRRSVAEAAVTFISTLPAIE